MEPRNYEAGAAGAPPAEPGSPSNGYPTAGNPGEGTPATKPGAFWMYKIGESLRNVITAAGLTPSDSDLTLFQQAILKLVSATNHVVRLEDVTFAPGVADGDAVYWDNGNSLYDKAQADGTDKQKMVGFADVTNSLVEAFGRSALFAGLTAGAKYYLSGSTAGAITATAPAEKVVVGLAKSATVMFVDVDPIAGTPIQDQTTWNTGTDTTESIISPDKLDAKIKTLVIGEGQTWQDLSGSRADGVTYTNTSGKAIMVLLSLNDGGASSAGTVNALVDGVAIGTLSWSSSTARVPYSFIVPNESTYRLNLTGSNLGITKWAELR